MKKVIDFLKENEMMTLATSHHDHPRASIVEYYMVGDSVIFATTRDSMKAENLNHNKHISMSVFAPVKYVTIDGAVIGATDDQKESYDRQLLAKHPEYKEMIEKGEWHDIVYFQVIPEVAYFSDTSRGIAPPEIFRA